MVNSRSLLEVHSRSVIVVIERNWSKEYLEPALMVIRSSSLSHNMYSSIYFCRMIICCITIIVIVSSSLNDCVMSTGFTVQVYSFHCKLLKKIIDVTLFLMLHV